MGKTDIYLMPVYEDIFKKYKKDKIHFYGSTSKDKLSKNVRNARFFDLQLNNWNINSEWESNIAPMAVCLRTSGFSKDPNRLIENFARVLDKNGILMIDWTMGSDHYARDSNKWSWGWEIDQKRCFGDYQDKKCYLYSSYLSKTSISTDAFNLISSYASKLDHYKNVENWYEQINSEFKEYFLNEQVLNKYFKVLEEISWTPISLNGRAQFYLIQILQRK